MPAANPLNALAPDHYRAVLERRSGNRQNHTGTQNHQRRSQSFFLPRALGPGGLFVFARLVLVVPFADLLFELFGDNIDRRVKITFDILGKQIRPPH
jgi:hypothetical protein